jgi:uncharacterized damage-inducible protein DinB
MDKQSSNKENEKIAVLLNSSFEGQAWHGASIISLLEDVSAEQALKHPIPNAHSIWEIVQHVTVYEKEAKNNLEGKTFPFLPQDENWPPIIDTSEDAWKRTVEHLKTTHYGLLDAIAKFDPDGLDNQIDIVSAWPVPWSNTSYYTLLHGTINHDVYHAGQIAVLKKG